MSLITRCPACTTLFKVVPDQLRVSEGWVRCGQCDEVFDANAHLQGDGQPRSLSQPEPVNSESVVPPDLEIGNAAWQTSVPPEDSGVDTEPQMPVDAGPQMEQELVAKLEWPEAPSSMNYDALMDVRPGAVFHPEPALHIEIPSRVPVPLVPEPEPEPAAFVVPIEPSWEPLPRQVHAESPVVASKAVAEVVAEVAPEVAFAAPQVSQYEPPQSPVAASAPTPLTVHAPTFMKQGRKASPWNTPWVRRGLVGLALLLVAGLGLQFTLHERDRLAASVPDLRPALTAMCDVLACQIAPFKQIDSVVIDASSFVKVRGDVYRLNLTLKNTAPVDVAAPAIELTFTDTQDQPMIRNVLSASELGARQGTLVAGGELTTTVSLSVKTTGSSERISGYRLLAFYP